MRAVGTQCALDAALRNMDDALHVGSATSVTDSLCSDFIIDAPTLNG